MTNSIDEIEETDVILITGSNTAENHPVIGNMVTRAVERRRARLIVIDPRRVELTRHAHIWLQPRPGTDVAWINGLIRVILEEGLWDKEYVESRTEGFEELREAVEAYTPEYVQRITGIPAKELCRAARLYAQAPKAMILYAMGITQHTSGTNNVKSLANLAMLCGNVGIRGGGVNPLRGQNNVQGACDMGALPNVFPGYQRVDDDAVLVKFQRAWSTGARLSDKVGLGITDMFPAILDGRLRAMYVMGENPVLSDANTNHVVEALKALDFLVVQDIFMSETAQLADVVLPAASFAEKDGTFTNTERRVQRIRKAVDPPGEALPDWQILSAVARRIIPRLMARGDAQAGSLGPISGGYWDHASPAGIMDEIASVTPSYAGISYARLEQGGLQWPCLDKSHPGTPYLHKGRFARGLGKFHGVQWHPAMELPDDEYPFYLSTGRIREHYHTGTMTRRSKGLHKLAPEARIQMNPADALAMDIAEGDWVKVISRRGAVQARVRLTDRSAPGMVFGTFHFPKVPINQLTNDALDPTGKIPEFKVAAVRVEKLNGTPQE